MIDVTAIVVAHDSGSDLRRCLSSFRRELDLGGLAGEVVLVDNASRDAAPQEAAELPWVTLVSNSRNRGFGAAVNQGFRLARGRRVLLLNPDVELCAGSLLRLLGALDSDPGAGLAAPALLLPDGTRQPSPRRFYDLPAVLAQRTRFGRMARGRRALVHHLMLDGPPPGTVDWVTGAAMLLDPGSVPQDGPFDERYFLYFEDVDLCRRLRAQGRTVRFEPEAVVRHVFARGSRLHVPWNPLLWHHLRSGLLYAARWSGALWSSRWWRVPGRILAGAALRALVLLAAATALACPGPAPLLALLGLAVLPGVAEGRLGSARLPGLAGSAAALAGAGVVGLALSGVPIGLPSLARAGLWALCSAALIDITRRTARRLRRSLRRLGLGHTTCLLAGDPQAASLLLRSIREQPGEGLEVAGFVPLDPLAQGGPTPRLASWDRVEETARDLRAQGVLLAGSADDLARAAGGVDRLRRAGVEVAFALTGSVELLQPEDARQVAGHPLMPLGAGAEARVAEALSSLLGRAFAAAGLLLLLPLVPVLALASLLASGRSPLLRLPRSGRDLRPFSMLKLRSGPGEGGDSGGGRIGAFLRAVHADELPQIWNVIVGQMCLVGPRPTEPFVAERLRPWEAARFRLKPGITGVWQIDRLRRWRLEQMIASDLLYVLRWSPRLDARILVETVLGRRNV